MSVILSSRLRTSSNSCAFFFFSSCWLCFRLATFLFWSFMCLRSVRTFALLFMTVMTFFPTISQLKTMTQGINSSTYECIPSVRFKQLNFTSFSVWHNENETTLMYSDYVTVKQLLSPTLFLFHHFHHVHTNTHTCFLKNCCSRGNNPFFNLF